MRDSAWQKRSVKKEKTPYLLFRGTCARSFVFIQLFALSFLIGSLSSCSCFRLRPPLLAPSWLKFQAFFFVRCILGAPGSFVLVFPFWCFFVYSNAKVEAMLLNDFTQSAKQRQTSLTTFIIIAKSKMIIYHACHSCPKVQWNFQNSTASHRHILSQSITSLQAQKTRQSNQYRATSRYFVLNELIDVFS